AKLTPGPCLDLGAGGGRTHRGIVASRGVGPVRVTRENIARETRFPFARGEGSAPVVAVDWVRASVADLPAPVVADVAALPFRDAAFAAAVAVHAFGHLGDASLARAAAEASRVLAPGARLLVVEFAPGDLRAGIGTEAAGGRVREGVFTRYADADVVAAWFPALVPLERASVERATPYGARRRTFALFGKS
ncbi:MAG TPA: methyltransferase domain-containing protein, partial [Candidatus Thermoplasmatota archaeon]|nr:methyltransferase domain-containing protein [Candidatus Thermoplasmatota archaeon]